MARYKFLDSEGKPPVCPECQERLEWQKSTPVFCKGCMRWVHYNCPHLCNPDHPFREAKKFYLSTDPNHPNHPDDEFLECISFLIALSASNVDNIRKEIGVRKFQKLWDRAIKSEAVSDDGVVILRLPEEQEDEDPFVTVIGFIMSALIMKGDVKLVREEESSD